MHMEKSSFYFPYVIYAGVCVGGWFLLLFLFFSQAVLLMLMGVVIR